MARLRRQIERERCHLRQVATRTARHWRTSRQWHQAAPLTPHPNPLPQGEREPESMSLVLLPLREKVVLCGFSTRPDEGAVGVFRSSKKQHRSGCAADPSPQPSPARGEGAGSALLLVLLPSREKVVLCDFSTRPDEGAVRAFRLFALRLQDPNRLTMDSVKHPVHIATDVSGRYPKHREPLLAHPSITHTIASRSQLIVVHASIDLDHQLRSGTVEINRERPDRMLPAKLQPCETTATQFRPQHTFGRSLRLPQITSAIYTVRIGH